LSYMETMDSRGSRGKFSEAEPPDSRSCDRPDVGRGSRQPSTCVSETSENVVRVDSTGAETPGVSAPVTLGLLVQPRLGVLEVAEEIAEPV
jgi:hypothetical protein